MSTLTTSNYRIKEGYLIKRGHIVKSWKKRFFVLDNTTLSYYSNAGDTKPKGTINLAYARIVNNPVPVTLPNGISNKTSITNNLQRLWNSTTGSSSGSSGGNPSSSSVSVTTGTAATTVTKDMNSANKDTSLSDVPSHTTASTGLKGYTFTIIENGLLLNTTTSSSSSTTNTSNTAVVGEEWGLPGSDKRSGRLPSSSSSSLSGSSSSTESSSSPVVTEYLLSAESESERLRWIENIQYNIQIYQSIHNPSNNTNNNTPLSSSFNTTTYTSITNSKDISIPIKSSLSTLSMNEKANLLPNDSLSSTPNTATIDTSSLVPNANDHALKTNGSITHPSNLSVPSLSSDTAEPSLFFNNLGPSVPHHPSSSTVTNDLPSSLYIFTGTWNMAEELPPRTIQDWIPKDADVYAVSLQECMHTDAVLMAIHRHIGSSYIEIHHRIGATMKGLGFHGHIVLAVYVRDWMVTRGICRLSKAVRGSVALGRNLYLTRAANKGAVAISLPIRLPDNTGALNVTSALVFLSCHLTSDSHGKTKVDKRNRDARKMLDSLGLSLTTTAIDRARSQVLAAKFTTTKNTNRLSGDGIKINENNITDKRPEKESTVESKGSSTNNTGTEVKNVATEVSSIPIPSNPRAARVAALRSSQITSENTVPTGTITQPSVSSEITTNLSSDTLPASLPTVNNSVLPDSTNNHGIPTDATTITTDATVVEAIADLFGIDEDEEDDDEDMDNDGDEENDYNEKMDDDEGMDEGMVSIEGGPTNLDDAGSDEDALSEVSENKYTTNIGDVDSDNELQGNAMDVELLNMEGRGQLSRQGSTNSTVSTVSENDEKLRNRPLPATNDENKTNNETATTSNASSSVVPVGSPSTVNYPPNANTGNRKRGYSFWQTSLDLLSPALSRKVSSVTSANDYDKLLDNNKDNENDKASGNGKVSTMATGGVTIAPTKKTTPQRQSSALQASPSTPITVAPTNDNPLGIIPGRAYVMVAGDLNYRLQNISCEDTLLAIAQAGEKDIQLRKQLTEFSIAGKESSTEGTKVSTVNCETPWQVLLDADQMRQELTKNYNLLPGFVEAPISFPPTYRRKKGDTSMFLRKQGDHRDVNKVREAFATVVRKTANGEIVSAVNTDNVINNNNNNNENDPLLTNTDDFTGTSGSSSSNAVQPKKSELRVPSYTDRVLVRNPLLAGVPVSVDTFNQQRNKRKSRRLSKRISGNTPLQGSTEPNRSVSNEGSIEPSAGDSVDNSPIRSIYHSHDNNPLNGNNIENHSTPVETFVPLPPLRCIYYDSCDTVSVSDHAPVASLWELPFTYGTSNTLKNSIPYGPVHLEKLASLNHHHHHHHPHGSTTTLSLAHASKDRLRNENSTVPSYEYTCLPPFPFEIPAPVTVLDQHQHSEVSKNSNADNNNNSSISGANDSPSQKETTVTPTKTSTDTVMTKNDRKPSNGKGSSPANTKGSKDKYGSLEEEDDSISLDTDGLDPLPLSILQSSIRTNSKDNATDNKTNPLYPYPVVSLLPPSDPLFNTQRRAKIAYANIHGPLVLERLLNELSHQKRLQVTDKKEPEESKRGTESSNAETIFRTITEDSAFPFYEYDKDNDTEAINNYLRKLGLVPPPPVSLVTVRNSSTTNNTSVSTNSKGNTVGSMVRSTGSTYTNNKAIALSIPPPSLSTVPLDILPSHVREQLTKTINTNGNSSSTVKDVKNSDDRTELHEVPVPVTLYTKDTELSTNQPKEQHAIPATVSSSSSTPVVVNKPSVITLARPPSESFSNARSIWEARTSKP